MKFVDSILKLFQKPSAEIIAQLELEEAKRQFLLYKAAEEQARHMAACYTEKINRLAIYISKGDEACGK